jgi:hypothetical protein
VKYRSVFFNVEYTYPAKPVIYLIFCIVSKLCCQSIYHYQLPPW